jgi:Ohr subfamily peroxiredoxin
MFATAYRTQATAVGGRVSAVATADGSLKAQLSAPRERGGAGGPGTNAEQLLASALAASFLEGLKTAAAEVGLTLTSDANVTVTVCVEFHLETPVVSATVDVDLPNVDRDTAFALIRRARKACPYAHLLPGHFDVQVSVL